MCILSYKFPLDGRGKGRVENIVNPLPNPPHKGGGNFDIFLYDLYRKLVKA